MNVCQYLRKFIGLSCKMYKKSASELYEPNMSERQKNLKKSALLVQLSRQIGYQNDWKEF